MLIAFGCVLPDDDVERHVDERDLQVGRRPLRVGLAEERDLGEVLLAGRHLLLALADHAGEHVVVEVLAHARQLDLRRRSRTAAGSASRRCRRRRSRCGDSIAPPQTMTSFVARASCRSPSFTYSTPTHLPFSRISRVACECWLTRQVLAVGGRVEVALLRRVALAVLDVDVVPAGALHVRAVEVVGGREAELGARVEERPRGRVRVVQARVREVDRPALAAGRVRVVLLVLQLLEEREALGVAPARAAVVGPVVVVRGVAADVHHDVEVARPARHLPAGLVGRPPAERLLRHAEVAPVDRRAEERVPERRVGDVLGIRLAARLEREHAHVGDLARAAPRRTSPAEPVPTTMKS